MTDLLLRLKHHDERVLLTLVTRRRSGLDTFMRSITHLGGATVTIVAALALLLSGDGMLEAAGARGGFALLVSHLIVQVLKRSIARPRPLLPVGLESLVQAPDRFSLPSGHAAASLSIGLAIATVLTPLAAGLVVALALVIGVSRCYLGVHYPGDVVVGWLLAAAASLLAGPVPALLPHLG